MHVHSAGSGEGGGSERASRATSTSWEPDVWRSAVRNFADDGAWSDQMGPRPGEPGCLAPAAILAEFGYVAGVTPLQRRGTA